MAKDNDSLLYLVLLVLAIFALLYFLRDSRKQDSFEAIPGSHRPYAGDFLVTTGNEPTSGGYELESAAGTEALPVGSPMGSHMEWGASHLESELCEECVSHCVAEKVRAGLATSFHDDRRYCFNFCKIECNPETGF